MLTKLKTLNPTDVAKLEGKILDADNLDGICVNCLFDIELKNGQKLELKSYSASTLESIATSTKFKKQFKAYLAQATDMNSFEYVFNGRKFGDLNYIKENFKALFINEADDLFDTFGRSKFQLLFGVDNVDDFIQDVLPDLDSPIYNFIKIEY